MNDETRPESPEGRNLMGEFSDLAADVMGTMLAYSRRDDPMRYGQFEEMCADGSATLQIRVNVDPDESVTHLVVLDTAGELLAILGSVTARKAPH